jgi:hypothetical protein
MRYLTFALSRLWVAALLPILLVAGGCPPQPQEDNERPAPLLRLGEDLQSNIGLVIRIEGTAHYLKVAGPSVAGDDFEVRVYPRTVWGPEMDGKMVTVTGRLERSDHALPPDPSVTPGEYWLADAKWKPRPAATEKEGKR